MQIKKINITKSNDGLEDIKMDKLTNVVLIAGKNGSGKSRILRKISETFSQKPKKSDIEQLEKNIALEKSQIRQLQDGIIVYKEELLKNPQHKNSYENSIFNYQRAIDKSSHKLDIYESFDKWKLIETTELAESYVSVNFVPKNLNINDSNAMPPNNLINNANAINNAGVENIHSGTFAKIQVIQNAWFESTHQFSELSKVERNKSIEDYEKLKGIINIFLNVNISRDRDGAATIFGFKLAQANLSDGQKILLQLCLAIYSQEASLKGLILIMDEPENHLHPSVIIEIIDKIMEAIPNGQLWIATHSVPLLAHFDTSKIWYVENGKIEHAGKIPEKVLGSLLGNEDEIQKLQDFISLPAQLATSRYAFECLLEPSVVMTGAKDPQSIQIRSSLSKISSSGKLRILDYGAGKGRLISNIVDLDKEAQEKLIDKIEYIAFDKFPNDKIACESSLSNAYGDSTNRYFNDWDTLTSIYHKGTFDIVIMCNVLHEIEPKHWLKLFKNNGEISSLLKENGILLLVEDQQIPVGEKAYQNGFLVLDTAHLKELFKVPEKGSEFIILDEKNNGRLKAHSIPKRCLIQIDNDSIDNAIKTMSETAKRKIIEIRERGITYQDGKLHGFWIQQFANAQLILAERTV